MLGEPRVPLEKTRAARTQGHGQLDMVGLDVHLTRATSLRSVRFIRACLDVLLLAELADVLGNGMREARIAQKHTAASKQ